jgi:hypothetical protein
MATFYEKVKQRYFEKKAERTCLTITQIKKRCGDRMPSELIEELTETLNLDDSRDLNDHLKLEK